MNDSKEIRDIANELLNRSSEPVQAYIIMKELLKVSKYDSRLAEVREKMLRCRWVHELAETQEANGGWGRFHSRDSSIKRKFPTTENAVSRALALGLDGEDSILQRTAAFMAGVISGQASWCDRVEKFNEWPVITNVITAATLSSVDRNHPVLGDICKLWGGITEKAFETGEHDLRRELAAFEELTGICPTKKDSKLNKKYPLILLSASDNCLPLEVQKAYLKWIWNNREGIYYLTGFSMDILPEITSKEFPLWLRAVDIISDYDYGRDLAQKSIEYIWSLREENGLWDFGANSKASNCARIYCGWQLADSWRDEINRQIDCTIRILLLLRKH